MCGVHRRMFASGLDRTLYCRPMPSTEVPTSPPGRPPEPFSRRKRVRYEELDPDELLHLIDRLEDERSRALRREGIWISFIAHLLLFWFLFYGPKFRSHQPHVVNPNDNKKDLTYLEPSARCAEAGQAPEAGPAFRQEPPRAIASPHARSKRPCSSWRPCAGPDHPFRLPRNRRPSSRLRRPAPQPSNRHRRVRQPATPTAVPAVAAQRAQAGPHSAHPPQL